MVPLSFQIKHKNHGFTLVELLVVVGLLGILITLGFTSYTASFKNARDARRKTDLETIKQALELYRSDNPSTGYANVTSGSTETYLKPALTSPVPYFSSNSFPKDPQTAQNYYYYYERTGNYTYNLCTYLENKQASDPNCPSASVLACKTTGGTQNCNYGITQP